MKQKNIKPINSHLIMYDQPKVAIIKGYVERVFGVILSQYAEEEGEVVTCKTFLTDEELHANWNVYSNTDDHLIEVHYFKSFPILTMDDVSKAISRTDGNRDIEDSFDDLLNLGAIVPTIENPIEVKLSVGEKEYYTSCEQLRIPTLKKEWIPTALKKLYSIQKFLKCRIVLTSPCEPEYRVDQHTLDFMNQLLENQRKNQVFVTNLYGNEETFINDGVYTYGTSGIKVAMTREKFIKKHPDSYEF